MSAPVNVLAVLDALIESTVRLANGEPVTADAATVALAERTRAAVAELIEADKRIAERARRKAGGGWWMISNEDMTAQRTALARVRGSAA